MKQYFSNCQTLNDAKTLYRKLAFELHPDTGGSTAAFQELLNQFQAFRPSKASSEKCSMEREYETWNAYEYAYIINQLLHIHGIDIEICGSFVYVHGDTKAVKDQIKAVKTGDSYKKPYWHMKRQNWVFSPTWYVRRHRKEFSMDDIRNFYGSHRPAQAHQKEEIEN